MKSVVPGTNSEPDPDETGLPWLRTWTSVYLLVIINFILWVALLAILPELFS